MSKLHVKCPGCGGVVTIRGAEHVIPMEEAEDLRDALDVALAGRSPQIICEVLHRGSV